MKYLEENKFLILFAGGCGVFLLLAFMAGDVFATSAKTLATFSTQAKGWSDVVMGPIGSLAITVATIGGMFSAFMRGNVWLALGVLLIGVLFSMHMETVAAIFGAAAE